MSTDDLLLLKSKIERFTKEIGQIDGSLKSMVDINNVVDDVVSTTDLQPKHIHHMAACDMVFNLHLNDLIERQAQLITLLQEQRRKYLEIMDKMKCK